MVDFNERPTELMVMAPQPPPRENGAPVAERDLFPSKAKDTNKPPDVTIDTCYQVNGSALEQAK
jgi:hypothetical protein